MEHAIAEEELAAQSLCFAEIGEEGGGGDNADAIANADAVEVGYEMRILENRAPILVRQLRARGLSFQLWPAASALCWYLEERCGVEGLSALIPGPRRAAAGRFRVLELGAGTGMVGMMAARLGAEVLLTDLPHVLPNLMHNVALNEGDVSRAGGSLSARTLRWGVQEDVQALDAPYDLILASDVVYYDTLFDPLLRTLKWLVGSRDGGPCPPLLLGHLRRWKKDSQFFKKASKHFDVEVVHRHPAAAGARIGVLVYAFTKRVTISATSFS